MARRNRNTKVESTPVSTSTPEATLEAMLDGAGLSPEEKVEARLEAVEMENPAPEAPEAPEAPTVDVEAVKARLEALDVERKALVDQLAKVEVHYLVTSKVPSPVGLVRERFVEAVQSTGQVPVRKTFLQGLIREGVAPNTVKTQYQVNRKLYLSGKLEIPEVVTE